jgi:iron complex transport system substrate-binding protein
VVVIGPGTAANIFALGAGERIVAVSDYNTLAEAADLPRVGGLFDPNNERIAALRPDLLIVQGLAPKLERFCAAVGIEYRSFSTDTLEEWRAEMAWLARRLGAAEQLPVELQRMGDGLAALTATRDPAGPVPGVLLVAFRRPDEASGLMVVGGTGFLDELLTAAGGRNVLADSPRDYLDLNEESLIRLAPEVILEFHTDPDETPDAGETLALWRRAFPQLPAVRDGRVLLVVQRDALIPGPSMLETARAMAAALQE